MSKTMQVGERSPAADVLTSRHSYPILRWEVQTGPQPGGWTAARYRPGSLAARRGRCDERSSSARG